MARGEIREVFRVMAGSSRRVVRLGDESVERREAGADSDSGRKASYSAEEAEDDRLILTQDIDTSIQEHTTQRGSKGRSFHSSWSSSNNPV